MRTAQAEERRYGLGRLAPTPRLVVFAVLSTLFTVGRTWWAVGIGLAVALALLLAGRRFPRAPLTACASAVILTFLGNALFAEEPAAFRWWVFRVSQASLLEGLRFSLRIAGMILPAIAYIAVTPLYELRDGFRGLRLPAVADMYLSIMLRYVDILWYDIQVTMKAMAVRGVNWQAGVREKVRAFRRLMMPLIFRVLEHIEAQSLAIDNRGGIFASRQTPEVVPGQPAVRLREVHVLFEEGKHTLVDVTLDIEHGQTTAILGPSGSGRTSLLLLCTGLIPHSVGRMRGEVEVYGHNTKTTSLSQLGRLSRIVFPSAVQGLVGLTVQDELEISLRVSNLPAAERRRAMVRALQAVGLDESFLPRTTLGLSGGEMQRVALASAIVAGPLLLALDNVTVQLDPRGRREVVGALQSLMRGRMTTVISDPHLDLLQRLSRRFLVLDQGRIVADTASPEPRDIARARMREPEWRRLGRALGVPIPADLEGALETLRPLARSARPPRRKGVRRGGPGHGRAVLRATGIKYRYPGGPQALKGVEVTFHSGELMAILGSNGSGKTTLALLAAGALTPDEGEIWLGEQRVRPGEQRGRVGYVFQEPTNQMVAMSVVEELAFGPRQLGWEEARVQAAVARELERFRLPADAVPLRLPPATQRKVAIAATLTMDPQLLILDEPTNNLDEEEARSLMDHLVRLRDGGRAVVIITHDVELACAYADRVLVMSEGQVLVDAPTRQAMARPDLLAESDVLVPPVVALSLALWPESSPALTVDEMVEYLGRPVTKPSAGPGQP